MLCCLWLLSIVCASLIAYQFGVERVQVAGIGPQEINCTIVQSEHCTITAARSIRHSLEGSSLLFFVLPFTLILFLHALIGIRLYRTKKQLLESLATFDSSSSQQVISQPATSSTEPIKMQNNNNKQPNRNDTESHFPNTIKTQVESTNGDKNTQKNENKTSFQLNYTHSCEENTQLVTLTNYPQKSQILHRVCQHHLGVRASFGRCGTGSSTQFFRKCTDLQTPGAIGQTLHVPHRGARRSHSRDSICVTPQHYALPNAICTAISKIESPGLTIPLTPSVGCMRPANLSTVRQVAHRGHNANAILSMFMYKL